MGIVGILSKALSLQPRSPNINRRAIDFNHSNYHYTLITDPAGFYKLNWL